MSSIMESNIGQEHGPVTPIHHVRSNTTLTNSFGADMLRYPVHHYGGYADSRSGSQTNEDGDDSNVIYVSGIVSSVEDVTLYELFGQFGQILNVVRRPVGFESKPGGVQQYAFIRFGSAEEAQHALQAGEISIDGRKLTIKPRERRPRRYFSHENPEYRPKYGGDGSEKILSMLHKTGRPDSRREQQPFEQQYQEQASVQVCVPAAIGEQVVGYDQSVAHSPGMRAPEDNADAPRAPMFMSKALFVAGLPYDMSPKELFRLFAEQGPVEGCYIFPFLDPYGRRFGHMVMASFFAAQKAQETFDRCTIRNCVLEVGYRHLEPVIQAPEFAQQNFQGVHTPPFPVYCPTGGPHQSWPHPYLGPAAGIAPSMMGFNQQYVPFSPGPLSGVQHPYGHQSIHMMPPHGIEQSFVQYGTPPNSPPFQSHPFGWQTQGRAVNRSFQSASVRPFQRRPSYRPTASTFIPSSTSPDPGCAEPHIRSISNSSSSTLVSAPYDKANQGPLVANGTLACTRYSTYREDIETSPSDKQSTPSPVVVRSVSDVQEVETPTKSSAKPTFEMIPEGVPETSKPADPANLFVKNFDDDVVSDPDDLKKLFEPYGPVASAHLAMIPGTNRNIGYGFVAFAKADDAATAKRKLNGSMIGKKRLFVSYAERKEERTQRLKLHFTRARGSKGDGRELQDYTQSDAGQSRPSDTGDEGSVGSAGNAESDGYAGGEQPSSLPEDGVNNSTQPPGLSSAGGGPPEVSHAPRINGGSGEVPVSPGSGLPTEPQSPAAGENSQHIMTEQEITVTTRWRGRTQLSGITEVEEEEGAHGTSPTIKTSTAYVEPAILQSHEQTFNAVSGGVLATGFQEQVTEYKSQVEPVSPDAPGDFNQAGRNTNSHRQQRYGDRSPSPRSGGRGHAGGQYYHYNQNGGGRGYYRYNNQNGGYGRGNPRFSGNNRGGGYHQGFGGPSGPRVAYFNGGTQPFNSVENGHEGGPQGQQNRKKKWQGGNRNGRGGHQQRSGGPVGNMMMEVNDAAQGAVAAY